MKKRILGVALLGCLVAMMLTGCLDYGMWYIHVKDNNDDPVEGVQIQLCDDSTCVMLTTDDIGYVDFDGESEQYDVHVISVPDGYEYTGGDLVVKQFEELKIVVNKTGGNSQNGGGNSNSSDSSDGEKSNNTTTYSDNLDAGPGWKTSAGDKDDYSTVKNDTVDTIDDSNEEENSENNTDTNNSKKVIKVERTETQISFSTTDVNGNSVDDSIFAQNTLTMVNIWEPWCGPCRSEMPDIESLYQQYRDEGFMVIGVYSDSDGLNDVLSETGVTYPILKSTSTFSSIVNQTQAYPTTFFVDSEGYILKPADDELPYLDSEEKGGYFVGSRDYSTWKSMIDERM